MSQSNALKAILLAYQHQHLGRMRDSAARAASDARACLTQGLYQAAYERACCSLAYSVGVFGTAYQHARALAEPRPLTVD